MSVEIPDRWERVEGLHFGPVTSWVELAVDEVGNLVAVGELLGPGLPSRAAPAIIAARSGTMVGRKGRPKTRVCYSGPAALLGPIVRAWGAPATVRDEFDLLGLPLLEGNEDRSAGFVRIGELLRADPEHKFPAWHKRAGEPGSPRLFFVGCPNLVEQLSSAPVEEDDEPLPRSAVSRRWEAAGGGLVAALRYAVMSRPSPSKTPKNEVEDPRDRFIQDRWEKEEAAVTRRPVWDHSNDMGET